MKKICYEFKLNKNKTVLRGETTLAILKQIIDPSNKKVFDWAFATNQDKVDLDTRAYIRIIITLYEL